MPWVHGVDRVRVVLTEKMMGAEVAELAGMSAEMLEREIGGLEAASKHAAVLAVDGLREVLRNVG